MRIVMVNWSRIWDGTRHGGGVGGYMLGLARVLRDQGHDVIALQSGLEEVPSVDPNTLRPSPGPVEVRRHWDFEGIRCFEVVNSPVLAPGRYQNRQPLNEIASAELDRELTRFASLIKPDVIHLHNIEGLTASAVCALRQGCGSRIVYSVHNYHTVCPQIYLMKDGATPCHDSQGGAACVSCVSCPGVSEDPDKEWHRRWTGAMQRLNVPIGPPLMPTVEGRLPDAYEPAQSSHDVERAMPLDGTDIRGIFKRPGLLMEEYRVSRDGMDNTIRPEPHAATLTPFGERRKAMIAMLNECDRVLAVSSFVQRRMTTLGVRASVIKTMTIGTQAGSDSNSAKVTQPTSQRSDGTLRVCFLGFNHIYKGLHVLLDAIESMPTDLAARVDLSLFVGEIWRSGAQLTRIRSRVRSMTTLDGYQPHELSTLLHGVQVGVVPSIWWDNGPQTVMEFLAHGIPVVGANIGGIPDFIEHGRNGLLFHANDRADLARTLSDLVRDPAKVESLRSSVTPPKNMDKHARELIAEYAALGAKA
ncbi:MAG: glycosyltransferase [Planctomycetes bacterium]|nr:glycosyltransferase [Planctomycetota bacterium]